MAVIGNQPAQSFNTIRKQTITGDSGSSYSLDHSVSGPNDLEVFVNNVRQEPTVAYDASSQTLTMTEGIDSTDDFYVIYKAQTLGSIVHPKDQPLETTTVTASGDLKTTGGGLLTMGADHTVTYSGGASHEFANVIKGKDNIRAAAFVPGTTGGASVWWTRADQSAVGAIDGTNVGGGLTFWANNGTTWTHGMSVDSSGYILKPNGIVAFRANLDDGNVYSTGWNDIVYDESVTQRGTSYNSTTGVFTAPVGGWYQFNAQATFNNNSDNDGTISICIDNSTADLIASVSQANTGGSSIEGRSLSGCAYLNKGQNVRVKCYFSVASVTTRSAQQYAGWFSGFLIG